MISLIEARPGQGKSVYATYLIDIYLSKKKFRVLTNMDIKTKSDRLGFVETWDDILSEMQKHVENNGKIGGNTEHSLIIILDELSTYIDARNWDALPQRVKFILRQHRKFGVDLIGFSQSVKDIDVAYRRLVQELFTINKLFVFTLYRWTFGFFWLRKWDADDIDKDKADRRRAGLFSFRVIYVDPPIFELLDSWQIIWPKTEGIVREEVKYTICSEGHKHRIS